MIYGFPFYVELFSENFFVTVRIRYAERVMPISSLSRGDIFQVVVCKLESSALPVVNCSGNRRRQVPDREEK